MNPSSEYPTYASLRVRPLINCKGTYTIISGSLLLPQARLAMTEASRSYVDLDELMEAAGVRIANLMKCEWGLITGGCAAALAQITAACVAGSDPEKMARLPDTEGMKNEVLYQSGHLHVYTHAIRSIGVNLIEVKSARELKAAINPSTAMFAFFGHKTDKSAISINEVVTICHAENIPVLVDAAAERPDVPNVYLSEGVDAVAYSGGKCL